MSEFLFSTSQLYLSESEQVEAFIVEELITPNVSVLTTFMVVATLGILLTLLVKLFFNGNDNFWPDRGVRLVESSEISSIFDNLRGRKGLKDIDIGVYRKLGQARYGGTMELRRPIFFVKDVELVKQILVKDFDHFVNRRKFMLENPLIMKMLSNLTGQEWKDMRTVLTPSFTTSKIRKMYSYFNSCGVQLAKYVRDESDKEENRTDGINITECFGRYTMDVIATACFGVESSCLAEKDSPFYKHGKMFQLLSPLRMAKVFIVFLFPRLATLFRISFIEEESVNFFKNIVQHIINHRANELEHLGTLAKQDFLQLLLDTREKEMKIDEPELTPFEIEAAQLDETSNILDNGENTERKSNGIAERNARTKMYLTDELILAQSIMFLLAGFDTTSSLLTFAAYALALHPDCQEKLFKEIEGCLLEKEGSLDHDTVNSMQYMDWFINETLRMYPPATRLERRCTKEYQVPGCSNINLRLPTETVVVIPVIALHYDEKHFPDPDKFIPERFSPENRRKIHPYAFIPFGSGPRNCIGMRFAVAEAKAAIAHLVHNFVIEPTSRTAIPLEYDNFSPLLKPVRMMKIRFRPRK